MPKYRILETDDWAIGYNEKGEILYEGHEVGEVRRAIVEDAKLEIEEEYFEADYEDEREDWEQFHDYKEQFEKKHFSKGKE